MNIKLFTAILLTLQLIVFTIQAQNYAVFTIPDSLKKNADVVVRYSELSIEISSIKHARVKVKTVKTILNKAGERHAALIVRYDNMIKVRSIKGKVYNAFGKEIRKIKQKDIEDYSNFQSFSLYEDNRVKYIPPPATDYPYTVEYEYETDYSGTMFLPVWMPAEGFRVAAEESKFIVKAPKEMHIRFKDDFFKDAQSKIFDDAGNQIYSYSVKNMKAVEQEDYTDYLELLPHVILALDDFEYGGYEGNMSSWENFGLWIKKLNQYRQDLPQETKDEVLALTADASSDREKAQLIYEYMQRKTRYVNIAVGIGGFQPFPASVVDDKGYGDCKALSNYTASLLSAVGVKSHYSFISAGEDASPIDTGFVSSRFNHAVICVPFETDTVWLECTSQQKPFGYLGTFTDDRNALIITDKGGKMVHTKKYAGDENLEALTGTLSIDSTGNLKASLVTEYGGLAYDDIFRIFTVDDDRKEKYLKEKLNIPALKIDSFHFENDKSYHPKVTETLVFSAKNYGTVSSSRMFFQPLKFKMKIDIPKRNENRKSEIRIRRTYTSTDSLLINLPAGYLAEFLPKPVNIDNAFGTYRLTYQFISDSEILLKRFYRTKEGKFPAERYDDFRQFFKDAAKADRQNIVLKKKSD